jgi:tetratricopeptide (TPR) repeat protein
LSQEIKKIYKNQILSVIGIIAIQYMKGYEQEISGYITESLKLSSKNHFEEYKMYLINFLVRFEGNYLNREKAYKMIRFVLKNSQKNTENHIEATMNLGTYYKNLNKISTAIKIYSYVTVRASEKYPELKVRALLAIAMCHMLLKQYESAKISCFEAFNVSKTCRINKYDHKIYEYIGTYNMITGDLDVSAENYKKAIRIFSERQSTGDMNRCTVFLSNIYYMLGNYKEALSIIKSVLPSIQEMKSQEIEIRALQNISRIYYQIGKYDLAEENADKAIILSNYLKDDSKYFISLTCKINVLFKKIEMKKVSTFNQIFAIIQIFKNIKGKVLYTSISSVLNLMDYHAGFLRLVYKYKLSGNEKISREKLLVEILNKVNSEIDSYEKNDEHKAELIYLYCRLYKYAFDLSDKFEIEIEEIDKELKDNYNYRLIQIKEVYTDLYSEIKKILYINRLKEIAEFPLIV